jgi:hypothetical protein
MFYNGNDVYCTIDCLSDIRQQVATSRVPHIKAYRLYKTISKGLLIKKNCNLLTQFSHKPIDIDNYCINYDVFKLINIDKILIKNIKFDNLWNDLHLLSTFYNISTSKITNDSFEAKKFNIACLQFNDRNPDRECSS